MYSGVYSDESSPGIYVYSFDSDSGDFEIRSSISGLNNPTFLLPHPNHRLLYAVSDVGTFRNVRGGGLTALSIAADTGQLSILNQQNTAGGGTCHFAIEKTGGMLVAANEENGSVQAFAIDGNGALGKSSCALQHEGSSVSRRQAGPHPYGIAVDPRNRFAIVADLGLDKLIVYKINSENSTIVANDPPFAKVVAGSGPRHVTFHPSGNYAYTVNELTCTVTGFSFDPFKGTLRDIETVSTLPGAVEKGFNSAEIQVHPSGKFLYASNRGHDSIAVFRIDLSSGKLTRLEIQPSQGTQPRNFDIDPTGKWLMIANRGSGNLALFKIDQGTGKLAFTGKTTKLNRAACVKFVTLPGS